MTKCVIDNQKTNQKTVKPKFYCSSACRLACFQAINNHLDEKYSASVMIKRTLKDYLNYMECGQPFPGDENTLDWASRIWNKLRKRYGYEGAIELLRCRYCGSFTNSDERESDHWWCKRS